MKDTRIKTQKIDSSPLVRKISALAQPLLSVRKHYKFRNFEAFCTKKCGRPHLKNPLLFVRWTKPRTADVFYEQPLTRTIANNLKISVASASIILS